jgi:hypothetical protein
MIDAIESVSQRHDSRTILSRMRVILFDSCPDSEVIRLSASVQRPMQHVANKIVPNLKKYSCARRPFDA